jgi:hypothetical protein
MKKLLGLVVVSLAALAVVTPATSQSLNRTFVVQLNASEEVPLCAAADASDRAVALFQIVDVAAGVVEYSIVASDLPGSLTGAHIHGPAPVGDTADVVQALDLTGAEVGVIAAGTFTNAQLVAAALANPELFYVNVHTSSCLPGAIRGQIG